MSQTDEEKRAYGRGYQAGRNYADREYRQEVARQRREEFRRQVLVAVLPELVRSPWRTGEKTWSSMEDFVSGAWKFADVAAKGTSFTGDIPETAVIVRKPRQP